MQSFQRIQGHVVKSTDLNSTLFLLAGLCSICRLVPSVHFQQLRGGGCRTKKGNCGGERRPPEKGVQV
ncbi:unnamed protein product [Ixodes pacificus]